MRKGTAWVAVLVGVGEGAEPSRSSAVSGTLSKPSLPAPVACAGGATVAGGVGGRGRWRGRCLGAGLRRWLGRPKANSSTLPNARTPK